MGFVCEDPNSAQGMRKGGCDFEASGWSCNGTGFLWFRDEDVAERLNYPCPRCNTALFLEKAAARGKPAAGTLTCPCCGPGVREMALRSALEIARGS